MSTVDSPSSTTSLPLKDEYGECSTDEHTAVVVVSYVLPRAPDRVQRPARREPRLAPGNLAERQGQNVLLFMGLATFAFAGISALAGHSTIALAAGIFATITVSLSIRIRNLERLRLEVLKLFKFGARFGPDRPSDAEGD
jgi:hypothetical protein